MKRYIDVIGFTLYPLVLFCILFGAAGNVQADKKVFRIGTGGNAGTYLPIGTLIAQALNEYNKAVDMALDAVQKLESIYVTEHLVKLFGTNETQAATPQRNPPLGDSE